MLAAHKLNLCAIDFTDGLSLVVKCNVARCTVNLVSGNSGLLSG